MRRPRLTLLALSCALPWLGCHGDGDPPGEPPAIGVGSATGPISDWPERGNGDHQPPATGSDPGDHQSARDAGVDVVSPTGDAGGAQVPALDASAPSDTPGSAGDAGVPSEADAADAGVFDAGPADAGPADASVDDAGPGDAGLADTSAADAGAFDDGEAGP